MIIVVTLWPTSYLPLDHVQDPDFTLRKPAKMQVIMNSDNQVDLNGESIEHWRSEITTSLERFNDWITRVEVHVTDENSKSKEGTDDIRCLIEARPANKQPVSVEVRGSSAENAISDGIKTMQRRLSAMVDKARTQRRMTRD